MPRRAREIWQWFGVNNCSRLGRKLAVTACGAVAAEYIHSYGAAAELALGDPTLLHSQYLREPCDRRFYEEKRGLTDLAYEYDGTGNRKKEIRNGTLIDNDTHDAASNRLLGITENDPREFGYNANGSRENYTGTTFVVYVRERRGAQRATNSHGGRWRSSPKAA